MGTSSVFYSSLRVMLSDSSNFSFDRKRNWCAFCSSKKMVSDVMQSKKSLNTVKNIYSESRNNKTLNEEKESFCVFLIELRSRIDELPSVCRYN